MEYITVLYFSALVTYLSSSNNKALLIIKLISFMAIPTVRDRKSAPEAYFKIPDSLKLSEREPSLVGTVPGLTDEMEAKFRGGYGAFSLGLHTKTISVGYLGS
ncbi:MAG TPA: hypothetical protein VJB06_00155, partial [archaeon]|nr:hypothetical protein [archaeon]